MRASTRIAVLGRLLVPALLGTAALAACAGDQPVAPEREPVVKPARTVQAFTCSGSRMGGVRCVPGATGGQGSAVVIGGQGVYMQLTSSNLSYDTISQIYQFDGTVKNLMNEAMGTPDGTTADPGGIQVFFRTGPTTTSGTGTVSVDNEDGTATFTAANQPYFAYHEILAKNQTSAPRTWRLIVPPTVLSFTFTLYVETDVQYLLVINEVLVNPGGTILDANGEWFEVYNAGTRPVQMQDLLISDSVAAGRRPYQRITSSLTVPAGGYVVLGTNADTTLNGGVPVDYDYANISLANSVAALKISRVYGSDTLTVDRTAYASGTISARNGFSRELTNPSLDNVNMDGGNWADVNTAAIYGSGGRGTPRAQNSTFVP
jgi:hypothetical protein